jgi:hypothetical protein
MKIPPKGMCFYYSGTLCGSGANLFCLTSGSWFCYMFPPSAYELGLTLGRECITQPLFSGWCSPGLAEMEV